MNLLSENTAKMLKSRELGYYSVVLHLEPAYQYRGKNTCPAAGQCKAYCLANGGRMRFDSARYARIRRTRLFYDNPEAFGQLLLGDIVAAQRKAARLGCQLTVRLNGTSDIDWRGFKVGGKSLFRIFPEVQFIDYTKRIELLRKPKLANYSLTYSVNERSDMKQVQRLLKRGVNCAVVFHGELPTEHLGVRVIDGDISDLRHLDPRGVVVGLRYKRAFSKESGRSIKVKRGFVILNKGMNV
jgi:hypothetical protein